MNCDSVVLLSAGKWFDGYNGEDRVVIDDLRRDSMPFNFLLAVIDRYLARVPIKGGFTHWNPREIIITCPRRP